MRKMILAIITAFIILSQCAAASITIEKELGSTYILWKWNCENCSAVNVSIDGEQALTSTSPSGEYLLSNINENELHMIKVVNCSNESDYAVDIAQTLPPFSFFMILLLITFSLLMIVFATTSTTRIITSIFSLIFTAFTYKYSIYYAAPISYLLLFVFVITFILLIIEVLKMSVANLKKKPKWEQDFWNWEGGEL